MKLAIFKEPQEEMGLIQGITPASREEWRVAVALEKYKIPYMYQVIVRGGGEMRGRLRGTIILDFLVFAPMGIPVQVYGNYWHSGERKAEDRLQEAFLRWYYNREVVALWGSELETQAAADEAVRSKVL